MAEKIKVFISWSGERSRLVARALADWLPDALHGVECWISDVDIGAGAQWSTELKAQLDACAFGILCLTQENLSSPWMLFEAGYLARSISNARVAPYLFQLKPTDVTYPLAMFQAAEATLDGTTKLITTLNGFSTDPVSSERVSRLTDRWWPVLEQKLATVPDVQKPTVAEPIQQPRDDRALLEEVLEHVRSLKPPQPVRVPVPPAPPAPNPMSTVAAAASAAATAAKAAARAAMAISSPAARPGNVILQRWILQAPEYGGGTRSKTVDIPWEFPISTAADNEPTYPPFLEEGALRTLRRDELDSYERILDEAEALSGHDGFDSAIYSARSKLRAERESRRQQ